ncbi:hypothetical protein BVY01_03435 [bacterium I07]|nr:hypothetical protein BVY01_03435 [bacterium I07]
MAVTFCGHNSCNDQFQLLVKDTHLFTSDEFSQQSAASLELTEDAHRNILIEAQERQTSLLFWHSHPFADSAWFSEIDNHNDLENAKFISSHLPDIHYGNVVVAQKNSKARLFNKENMTFEDISRICILGQPQNIYTLEESPVLDRNYRAFGKLGQANISFLRFAILATGGLGWQTAQQLVGIGARDLLLIDPDNIELTNMNRLPGAPYSEIGRPKVEVLSELIMKMNPEVTVHHKVASVFDPGITELLKERDILIGGYDSERARSFSNRLAVQYLKPYLDAGSEIVLENNKIKHAGGQVNVILPGMTPCLACNQTLDWKMMLYESLTSDEKEFEVERGYIRGVSEPSPSVVSINGVIASTLINELISLTTGFRKPSYYTYFDLMSSPNRMFTIDEERNENCPICSKKALLGYGDIAENGTVSDQLPAFCRERDNDE